MINIQIIEDTIDYGKITIQDCLDMYSIKGMSTTINDGKVVGFEKGDE